MSVLDSPTLEKEFIERLARSLPKAEKCILTSPQLAQPSKFRFEAI